MTLTTETGKEIVLPYYVMQCLNEFGNTVVSDKLLMKFGGRDGMVRAFRNAGVNVWIRISKEGKIPIVEKL